MNVGFLVVGGVLALYGGAAAYAPRRTAALTIQAGYGGVSTEGADGGPSPTLVRQTRLGGVVTLFIGLFVAFGAPSVLR
jgi:hypothetical protein